LNKYCFLIKCLFESCYHNRVWMSLVNYLILNNYGRVWIGLFELMLIYSDKYLWDCLRELMNVHRLFSTYFNKPSRIAYEYNLL
jgi:hypothetical protein